MTVPVESKPGPAEISTSHLATSIFTQTVAVNKKATPQIPNTKGFVLPVNFVLKTRGFSSWHPGSDLAAPLGTPVVATRSGCIVHAAVLGSYSGGYGNVLLLDVGDGITALYGHLSRYVDGLKEGSCYATGQVIGYVGTTGRSTGPHLHFEIRINGVKIDPTILVPGA